MESSLHLSSQFNQELESLRGLVQKMFEIIDIQILTATKAYIKDDLEAATLVMERDAQVNDLEKEIDDACIHIIAKRQPAASDLRLIMSIGKIVTDLERMGDESKKVAKSILHLQARSNKQIVDKAGMQHLSILAGKQVRDAAKAFQLLDTTLAKELIAADNELDNAFKLIVRQFITYMMEDPRTISAALDSITMARAFERIGDHSTNIAEQVIYIKEGRDIRHTNAN